MATNQLHNPWGLHVDEEETVIVADCRWITASWNGNGVTPVAECWLVATDKEIDRISWIARQMCSSTERPTVSSSATTGIDEWSAGRVKVAHKAGKRSSTTSIVGDWPWTTRELSTSLTSRRMKWDAIVRVRPVAPWWLVATGKVPVFINSIIPAYVCVDGDHAVYVSDTWNHRVTKWVKGAKEGIVVAGGQGQGKELRQLSLSLRRAGRCGRQRLCGRLRESSRDALVSRGHTGHCRDRWKRTREKEPISSIGPLVCPSIGRAISMSLTTTIIECNAFRSRRTE